MKHYQPYRVHVVVQGNVQGVGYRTFVQRMAHHYRIHGWVRNLYTGEVEFEAEGPREKVEAFLQIVRTGHPFALVTGMTTEQVEAEAGGEEKRNFEVRI